MMSAGRIEFDTTPSVSSRLIVGPSPRRNAITFFAPAVGHVTMSNDPVQADGRGFVLTAGQGPIHFDREEMGDYVAREWYALYSAGASGVSWSQSVG